MKRLLFLACAVVLWACVEEPTSPARCPDFCPGTNLAAIESLFTTAISKDSSFQGYVTPQYAGFLVATAEGGVDSRPISRMAPFGFLRVKQDSTADTTTLAIVPDSMKLIVTFLRPDAASRNLRMSFYQLPDSIDSTRTFADLAPSFAGPPLRVVNVDSLLALSSRRDSAAGDTVLANGVDDSLSLASHWVRLRIKFDSAHAPALNGFADSGRISLGVMVTADNKPTLSFAANELGLGYSLQATWFYRADSAGKLIRPDSIFYKCAVGSATIPCPQHPPDSLSIGTTFDSFVYTTPVLPPDSNLVIGGVPSTRTLLRIDFPKPIRDSSQIIRAQLLLIPTATAAVDIGDSVIVGVKGIGTDLGLKSPFSTDTLIAASAPFVGNPADTLRIELTPIYRFWQFDTTQTTAIYIRLLALRRLTPVSGAGTDTTGRRSSIEGGTFTTLRFYSSRTPAFRPLIRLTYVPRIKLGVP